MDLQEIYVGPEGVLVGSARLAQQMKDRIAATASRQELQDRKEKLARMRRTLKARVAELEAEYQAEAYAVEQAVAHDKAREGVAASDRLLMAEERGRGTAPPRLTRTDGGKR
jgi:circadian clock protein KaiC